MFDLPADPTELISQLVGYMTEAACKGGLAIEQVPYERLRNRLMQDPLVGPRLPDFVRKYRNLQQFRSFMQSEHKTWRERGAFIHEAFEPLFAFFESSRNPSAPGPAVPAVAAQTSIIASLLGPAGSSALATYHWDVFISHASEDKSYTDELYKALTAKGVKVWYDKSILTMGDSLLKKINEGLAGSRFGVVVLSHDFFKRGWPQAELDGLNALQMADGKKRVLPIWRGLEYSDVAHYSPTLAGLLASKSSLGIDKNVEDILLAIDWPNDRAGGAA